MIVLFSSGSFRRLETRETPRLRSNLLTVKGAVEPILNAALGAVTSFGLSNNVFLSEKLNLRSAFNNFLNRLRFIVDIRGHTADVVRFHFGAAFLFLS